MNREKEQRKDKRVETHIPVRFRVLGGGDGTTGSVSKNLSQGGVRFRTREFVPMACRLVVELDMPMAARSVKAISKVAWISRAPSGEGYEVGNRFLEISKKDKEFISENVDSFILYNEPAPTVSLCETKRGGIAAEGNEAPEAE